MVQHSVWSKLVAYQNIFSKLYTFEMSLKEVESNDALVLLVILWGAVSEYVQRPLHAITFACVYSLLHEGASGLDQLEMS